jgi:hypothetical protein
MSLHRFLNPFTNHISSSTTPSNSIAARQAKKNVAETPLEFEVWNGVEALPMASAARADGS